MEPHVVYFGLGVLVKNAMDGIGNEDSTGEETAPAAPAPTATATPSPPEDQTLVQFIIAGA